MSKTRPLSEVKAKLSEYVRGAEHGESVVITRHGRAVAALVGTDDLRALKRLRSVGPEGGLASVAGGWEHSEELVEALENSERIPELRIDRTFTETRLD